MRRLKFTVRRKTLNQIYVSFLRPTLEYASVVWGNCTHHDKLELKLQDLSQELLYPLLFKIYTAK